MHVLTCVTAHARAHAYHTRTRPAETRPPISFAWAALPTGPQAWWDAKASLARFRGFRDTCLGPGASDKAHPALETEGPWPPSSSFSQMWPSRRQGLGPRRPKTLRLTGREE